MENYNLDSLPNENYKKFFEKFKEIENLEVSKWNTNHIIGYFVNKYKEQYKLPYKFKFNSSAPSKCFEVFQVKKLATILSSDPEILKEYIDWMFINKVVKAKRRLTSISFLLNENIINEYKKIILSPESKFSRETPLPVKYINILSSNDIDSIKNYGDLAFIYKAEMLEYKQAFEQMKMLGFNFSNLDKII